MMNLQRARRAAIVGVILAGLGQVPVVIAQERGQLFATQENGYGRLVLSFPERESLPEYDMRVENGVLSLTFDKPVSVMLPDVGGVMASYLSAARIDSDGRGLRLALRGPFNFNSTEAGERLFIDIMPTDWQGSPPPLPQEVIDELAERARINAMTAERERKARMVAALNPHANVRVGHNPTFMRIQFDWTVPTNARYVQDRQGSRIAFEWPVDVDLRDLSLDLPPEIVSVTSTKTEDGVQVLLRIAEGVKPRFYKNSPSQYVLDIDIAGVGLPSFDLSALAEVTEATGEEAEEASSDAQVSKLFPEIPPGPVKPFVSVVGSTVRVVFPFEQDTPAAVFRRGDTVWMIFDTVAPIEAPARSPDLDVLVSAVEAQTLGDAQLVRLQLSQDRLATLGSEGMAWVLSLGDILLTPTAPMDLSRRRDTDGNFEIVADLVRPGRVHDFLDPLVGDHLSVVTAYPPARGIARTLDYVEFSALRSVHGLVVKPKAADVAVAIENQLAVLSGQNGLIVSAHDAPRIKSVSMADTQRRDAIDLGRLEEHDPRRFQAHLGDLASKAALAESEERDRARLDLAQYYLANRYAQEAMGILQVLDEDLEDGSLVRKMHMSRAVAATLSGRTTEALAILNNVSMEQDVDALIWRTIARANAHDFKGARSDAVDAASAADFYPEWVRNLFYFAAVRAALDGNELAMAERFIGAIQFFSLNMEERSLYHLLSGWLTERKGQEADALDIYGQVIAADFRPTRAEAIYRTLRLLDQQGTIDLEKAMQTLAAETMLWRGNLLEAEMQAMLIDFYFRAGEYRQGFEAVRNMASADPDIPPVAALHDEAQRVFGDLFLNGGVDRMGPVDALSLYYDFRYLTPPGVRGDEMIRNLARRLVRVDLLPQATELLQYQIDNRLRGVARTQVGVDLAVIYLADRRPLEALQILNATRLPDLPGGLQRQRRLLEARALLDAGRDQMALDILHDQSGRDMDMLRIEAHWKGRRFAEASALLESQYADDLATGSLSASSRMGVVRAAVGYVLANDRLGLDRLRNKFSSAMVTTPEWPMFDLVTRPIEVNSLEFKAVASQVSDVDGINAFLAAYRETYGRAEVLTPLNAS